VRPGIVLHGIEAGVADDEPGMDLEPTLSLKTQIVYMKDVPEGTPVSYLRRYYTTGPSRIATLPIGYNDGYRYAFTGKAEVIVRGLFAPVVGSVTMDYAMIDVTHIPGVEVGDEVILIGEEKTKTHRIRVEDLAGWANTLTYEIVCGLGKRVRRVMVE
jgi:alanine racemase